MIYLILILLNPAFVQMAAIKLTVLFVLFLPFCGALFEFLYEVFKGLKGE